MQIKMRPTKPLQNNVKIKGSTYGYNPQFMEMKMNERMRTFENSQLKEFMRRHSIAEHKFKLRQERISVLDPNASSNLNRDMEQQPLNLSPQCIEPNLKKDAPEKQPSVKDARFQSLMNALIPSQSQMPGKKKTSF